MNIAKLGKFPGERGLEHLEELTKISRPTSVDISRFAKLGR